jgi:hypothetical protein
VRIGFVVVALGWVLSGCKSQTSSEKEQPTEQNQGHTSAKPQGPEFVPIHKLLEDKGGAYDGHEVVTTGQFVSQLERDKKQFIRVEEPGAPSDGPQIFCLLMEPLTATLVFGQQVTIRGTKRGNALATCAIIGDGGH